MKKAIKFFEEEITRLENQKLKIVLGDKVLEEMVGEDETT